MQQQPPRIITHLLTLARQWNWSKEQLARELGITRSALVLYQYGHRRLTMNVYSAIAEKFGDDRVVRELLHHYAAVEYRLPPAAAVVPSSLPAIAAQELANYVRRFHQDTLHGGRGLYVVSDDARVLSAASQHLASLFRAERIEVAVLRADRTPAAADAKFALAAPLLLMERIDFACDAAVELLYRRADLIRPIVVTSMATREAIADEHLRRILVSRTRLIDIAAPSGGALPISAPSPELHVDAT